MYLRKGEGRPGEPAIGNQVEAAITSSFLVLIGIFFPSVTGMSVCLSVCLSVCTMCVHVSVVVNSKVASTVGLKQHYYKCLCLFIDIHYI